MAPNAGFSTLLLNDVEETPGSIEPFWIGTANPSSIEPFDIVGDPAYGQSIEPFWIDGPATGTSIEPFDIGTRVAVMSVEPFDILGPADFQYPPTDLGDGESVAADVGPRLGWWSGLP